MAKNSVDDWDTNPNNNTDVGNIPLGEGATYPSNVNNAFREIMAQIKTAIGSFAGAWTSASASGPASLAFAEDTDNGTNKVTLKAPASIAGDVDVILPGTADTLAGIAATQTLTNKRITPRVASITSAAEPAINTDNCDIANIASLATNISNMSTNLTGTPTSGQVLIMRIKDDGTARTISWGTSFKAEGVPLPTTTVISKQLTVAFLWNGSTWGCVGSAVEA